MSYVFFILIQNSFFLSFLFQRTLFGEGSRRGGTTRPIQVPLLFFFLFKSVESNSSTVYIRRHYYDDDDDGFIICRLFFLLCGFGFVRNQKGGLNNFDKLFFFCGGTRRRRLCFHWPCRGLIFKRIFRLVVPNVFFLLLLFNIRKNIYFYFYFFAL